VLECHVQSAEGLLVAEEAEEAEVASPAVVCAQQPCNTQQHAKDAGEMKPCGWSCNRVSDSAVLTISSVTCRHLELASEQGAAVEVAVEVACMEKRERGSATSAVLRPESQEIGLCR
jgi:hypothetical protein